MTQMLMKYIIRYDDTEINLNVKIKEWKILNDKLNIIT